MEKGEMKHFVLVHGACHGAWCWYKVASLLKSAGHKVTVLDLAASGIHPKQVNEVKSFSEYVEPLMEFTESAPSLMEEKVVLVGHSYGGLCISDAMEKFPERVSVAVYATAFMPGPDLRESLLQEFNRRLDSYMDTQFTFDQGESNPPTSLLWGPNIMASQFYQLSPPEDLTLAMSLVRPVPRFGDTKEVNLSREKYGKVPRVYIISEKDNILKEDFQRWMIENNPPQEVKVIADSDHMVMFSQPKELCSYLLQIAEKYP